jgi:hypothetical protein
MWPFKKKQESPEEIAAEKKLDEVTFEVAAGELDKEPPGMFGALQGPRKGEPAPGSEPGLREAFREGAEERKEKLGSAPPEPPPE